MQRSFEKRLAVALILLLALFSCSTSARSKREATGRFAEIYAVVNQAEGKVDEGNYRGALVLYQRALIEIEEFSDTFPDWKPDYVAYKQKEFVDKIESAVARLGPQEQRMIEARKIYLQAVECLREDKTEDSIAKLEKVIEMSPDYFDAYWMLGNAYDKLGEVDKAISFYQKATKIDMSSPLPHQSLGELYEKMGKYEAAIKEFYKAIQIQPEDIAPYIYSSWVYINMGDFEKALAVSRKALKIDLHNKVVYNNVGLIYQKMGKLDKAVASYKRAILEDHGYISPYKNLGLVYGIQGRHSESIDQYKQVLELDPKNASVHFNLGINYKGLRKKLLARYHLEQAARLYGYDTEFGKKALEKLEELDSL